MQSSHESDANWQKHDVQNHQAAAANLEQSAAINTKKTANSTNNEDALAVCGSSVNNPINLIENNPTVSNSAVVEMAIGGQVIDESVVEESDLNKSSTDESDIDESNTDESGFEGYDIDALGIDRSDPDESNIVEFYRDESSIERSDSDESSTRDYNLNDLRVEVSDLDQSNDEESDTDESILEESHFSYLLGMEAYYANISDFDQHEYNIGDNVSNVVYVGKLNNFVNYIDQCNSNKNFILKMHTKAIQDLTPLAEEPSALELGLLTDRLVLHVWVLQMQDPHNVDQWSGFLFDVIYDKLDEVTKNLWNKFVWHYYSIHCKNVSMKAVLDFLRATCCEYDKKPPRSISCISYIYSNLSSEY
ncbi:uncharacterized protein LOC114126194 [Aphis gossypii]|uniref:uncharacterized protein LOC114126194 n=1 Tax=Aphis gossypii TaxID=80765 RepID=UPI0021597DAB|nr:uncharacterized protein LOC114126194 [Aphis gossypii]XP_050057742.1 uncharacterized protein LOC114126194 [Aphis gossypii]